MEDHKMDYENELTTGELRYIGESTDGWRMIVQEAAMQKPGISDAVMDRISKLEDTYQEEFLSFFVREKQSSSSVDADELRSRFDELWNEKHPEFFDMEKLFSG